MAKKWYIVHVYSGFENKVKASLEEKIATSSNPDKFDDVKTIWSFAKDVAVSPIRASTHPSLSRRCMRVLRFPDRRCSSRARRSTRSASWALPSSFAACPSSISAWHSAPISSARSASRAQLSEGRHIGRRSLRAVWSGQAPEGGGHNDSECGSR